jgi:hypothetical protein
MKLLWWWVDIQYFNLEFCHKMIEGQSWSWSYGSWIYNYLCNQCLSPLTLLVLNLLRWGVLDTVLCDKVCQWLATGRWFSPGTPDSSTNKTYLHDITELLLKVALNTITLTHKKIEIWLVLLEFSVYHGPIGITLSVILYPCCI